MLPLNLFDLFIFLAWLDELSAIEIKINIPEKMWKSLKRT